MFLIIIGDVHGKVSYYKFILNYKNAQQSIQIGDFGFKREHEWFLNNIDTHNHKVLFGNHDDYNFLYENHSMGDFYYDPHFDLFTIRGAYSIDKHIRKEGVDYFPNEELDYNQINKAIDLYKEKKPKIVVSHDCPQSVRENLFSITDKSITSNGLERLLEEHEPDLWIFGHHHKSVNTMIGNTNFVCLDELETYEI